MQITVCSCFVFLIESDKCFLSSTPVLFSVSKQSSDLVITHTCLVSSSSYEMNVTLADLLALLHFLVGQLCFLIRQRVSLRPEEALFFFVNNSLPPSSSPLSAVYEVTAPIRTHVQIRILPNTYITRTNLFNITLAVHHPLLKLFVSLPAHGYINAKFQITHKKMFSLPLLTRHTKNVFTDCARQICLDSNVASAFLISQMACQKSHARKIGTLLFLSF